MFEVLFKYPETVFASGRLVLTHVLEPVWWLLLLGGAAVLFVLSGVVGARTRALLPRQRALLASLQWCMAGLVGLLLLQPALEVATLKPGINKLAVLIDNSLSMSFPAGTNTRLDSATVALDALAAELDKIADVDYYSFADVVRPRDSLVELSADGTQTRITDALETVLASYPGAPLAGIVVATDGADTGVSQSLSRLASAGVPVHTIGVGDIVLDGEIELLDVAMPVEVPPDARVEAVVTLAHQGAARAIVRVLEGGRLVVAVPVELRSTVTRTRIKLPFSSGAPGIRDLRFEVVPTRGDVLAENNARQQLLTVARQQRQVLYLEGEPRWEYKFIRRALASDDVVTLKSVLKSTDRKTYRQGVTGADELVAGFPADQASLFGFDLIVLGSLRAAELSDQQHVLLEAFVSDRGGSLLALAGRHALAEGGWNTRPQARVLPVAMRPTGMPTYGARSGQARVSRDGALSAVTLLPEGEGADPWATLPALADYQSLGAPKPAARTLLEFVDANGLAAPLLVVHNYGLGTAAVLATSSTWRWQTRTPEQDPRHQLFWRQLMRQLAEEALRERDVTVSTEGEALRIRASLLSYDGQAPSATAGSATVTSPAGRESRLELVPTGDPGIYGASLVASGAGVHRVDVVLEDGSTVTRFARLGRRDEEYSSPVQNVALLRRLAAITGAAYWTPETSAGIVEMLKFSNAGVKERQLLPLWDMPILFLILLALKGGEWMLRRRWRRI